MGINLQGLYNQSHQFSGGIVNINAPFVGNVLAIELSTKPEYVPNSQVIGYLYQHYQAASNGYALTSGKCVIALELPETDSLSFVPTPYLSDSYTLSIKYATIGAVVDGENTIGLPQQILDLPNNVQAIDLQLEQIENQIQEVEASIPTWDTLTAKPQTFPPSSHNHVKADITDLSLDWAEITGKPATFAPSSHTHTKNQITDLSLDWTEITGKPATFPPSSHTHTAEQITGLSVGKTTILLSANTSLESNRSYLATVNNLVCSLPANPAIGDWVEIANGNFSSFRINHGNTSQSILNNATSTTSGSTDSGIILKQHGYIAILFVGSNLWINIAKYRTVNNWLAIGSPEPNSVKKNYSVSTIGTYGYLSGRELSRINDNNTTTFTRKISGSNPWNVLATFPSPTILRSFLCSTGQTDAYIDPPSSVSIYRGNSADSNNLIYSATTANWEYVNRSVTNSTLSNDYLFSFFGGTNIAIVELELFGQSASGGEISVI